MTATTLAYHLISATWVVLIVSCFVEYEWFYSSVEVDDLKKLVRAVAPYHVHIPDYVVCNIPNKTVHGYLQPAEIGQSLKYVKGYLKGPVKAHPQIVNPVSKFMVSNIDTSLRFHKFEAVLEEEEVQKNIESMV